MFHDRVNIDEAHRIAINGMMQNIAPACLIAAEHAEVIGEDMDEYDPGSTGQWAPGFIEFLQERALNLVYRDIRRIAELVDADGYLTVYRSMIVPREWLDQEHDGRNLGRCWAWSEDCAIAHLGGDGDGEVRMQGLVHIDDVDWTTTVGLNACDDYAVGTENEIRLRRDATVVLERLEWRVDLFDEFEEYVPQRAFALP